MRVGDFSVEVVAIDGDTREVGTGHVLARPGQVYTLRLRNHGPLRAVADISIDGQSVTAGGLVLNAWTTVDLERPIHETERGRFTVIAEGNERVFGPDGGRDNPDLGVIEARFRRELPTASRQPIADPVPYAPPRPFTPPPRPGPEPGEPWRPGMPRVTWHRPRRTGIIGSLGGGAELLDSIKALMGASPSPVTEPAVPAQPDMPAVFDYPGGVERAAGTGLTGTSNQEFVTVHVGALEAEATVIKLRIVIGSEEALSAPRPLPHASDTPARPTARP